MARRLYLGSMSYSHLFFAYLIGYLLFNYCLGLPHDARAEDVSKFFDGYGRIVDCRVMTGPSAHTLIKQSPFNYLLL